MDDGNSPTKAVSVPSCAKQLQLVQTRGVIRHHAEALAESLKRRCINAGSLLRQDSSSASDSEAGTVSAAAVGLHHSSSLSADILKFFGCLTQGH